MIAIINYGTGNLASIQNMISKVGGQSIVTSDPAEVEKASKLILPGVGSFDNCVIKFRESGLLPIVTDMVFKQQKPILGVCVGMQMMMEGSEEGVEKGLGWFRGMNIRFRKDKLPVDYKVPHMGWSEVTVTRPSKLLENMPAESRFYFVHSYHALPEDQHAEVMRAEYGYGFTAAIQNNNIIGVQFHPEKSHKFGMKLFENFIKLY